MGVAEIVDRSRLAYRHPDADFVQVPQKVGRILVRVRMSAASQTAFASFHYRQG
jgi:hypothetical protein